MNIEWLRKHKTRRARIRELFEHRAVAPMAVKLSCTPQSWPSSSPSRVETIRSHLTLRSRELSLSSSKLVRGSSYLHKMLMRMSFSKMLIRKWLRTLAKKTSRRCQCLQRLSLPLTKAFHQRSLIRLPWLRHKKNQRRKLLAGMTQLTWVCKSILTKWLKTPPLIQLSKLTNELEQKWIKEHSWLVIEMKQLTNLVKHSKMNRSICTVSRSRKILIKNLKVVASFLMTLQFWATRIQI